MKKFILPIIIAACFILVNVLSIIVRKYDVSPVFNVFLTVTQVLFFIFLIVVVLYYFIKYYNKKK